MAALAREVMPGRPRLLKPQALRTGRWDGAPLSAAQRQYAAADAFASLACWRALERVPPPPSPSQEALAALERLRAAEEAAAQAAVQAREAAAG